jgi:membrane-associated phospholipid phosphatase
MQETDDSDVNDDSESDPSDGSTSGRRKILEQDSSKPRSISIDDSSHNLGVILSAAYTLILFVIFLAYGVIPGLELVVLFFFIYAAYNKRTRRFVKDWFPFVALILGYEALNGLVPNLSRTLHVVEPIIADKQLFGVIPTLVLQQFYRSPILDYATAFFYSLHFILPILFGFILWKYASAYFGRYTLALVVGTYSALLTFILYPVAPPWYGVNATRIMFQLDNNLSVPFYRSFLGLFQPNPYAAFPSLHATYPWLISLYALKIKKIKALPILIIPFGVWFSTIYLGEHYVIDVIGAVIYGTCAFLFVEKALPSLTTLFSTVRARLSFLRARSVVEMRGFHSS